MLAYSHYGWINKPLHLLRHILFAHSHLHYHQEDEQDHDAIGDLSTEGRAYTCLDSTGPPTNNCVSLRVSLLCAASSTRHYTLNLTASRHPFSFPPANLQC